MGLLRLTVGQGFLDIFELWVAAPITGKQLFLLFEFVPEFAVAVDQALRRIGLTGDYHWRRDGGLRKGQLRLLRLQAQPLKLAA